MRSYIVHRTSLIVSALALLATLAVLTPASAAEYNFSAAPTVVHNLTVTGTIYIIDNGDTISVYTADSVVTLLLATGRLTGGDVAVTDSIKGATVNATGHLTGSDVVVSDSAKCVTLDASGKITGGAGLAITGNAAMTGRVTGTDVAVTDSIKGVTVDATGKITGGAGLGITGAGAFSTRITGTDIAVTDSGICVTLDASGKITGGAHAAITGLLQSDSLRLGGGNTSLLKIIPSLSGNLDSLGIIVPGDTFWVVTH